MGGILGVLPFVDQELLFVDGRYQVLLSWFIIVSQQNNET